MPQAEQFGRDLLRAQTFTKAEVAEGQDTAELAAQKKADFAAIAGQLGDRYPYFQGKSGSRIGAGRAGAGRGHVHRAVPAAVQGAGAGRDAHAAAAGDDRARRGGGGGAQARHPAGAAARGRCGIVNTLVVGALAGLHALLVVSLFRPGSGIDLWLALLVTGVVTVVLWAVARPFRRLVSMVSLTREQFGGIVPGAGSGPMSRVWQRLRGAETDDRQTRWWDERRGASARRRRLRRRPARVRARPARPGHRDPGAAASGPRSMCPPRPDAGARRPPAGAARRVPGGVGGRRRVGPRWADPGEVDDRAIYRRPDAVPMRPGGARPVAGRDGRRRARLPDLPAAPARRYRSEAADADPVPARAVGGVPGAVAVAAALARPARRHGRAWRRWRWSWRPPRAGMSTRSAALPVPRGRRRQRAPDPARAAAPAPDRCCPRCPRWQPTTLPLSRRPPAALQVAARWARGVGPAAGGHHGRSSGSTGCAPPPPTSTSACSRAVDPANIPATKVTGRGEGRRGLAALACRSTCPPTPSTLLVTVVDTDTGWRVSGYDRELTRRVACCDRCGSCCRSSPSRAALCCSSASRSWRSASAAARAAGGPTRSGLRRGLVSSGGGRGPRAPDRGPQPRAAPERRHDHRRRPRQLGAPPRAWLMALATAMQESTLRNIDYGDRDSLGLFQQRPSQGWGRPRRSPTPSTAPRSSCTG